MAKITEQGDLLLKSIVSQLKDKGYMLSGTMISYYSHVSDSYIFCATDPMPPTVVIPNEELPDGKLVLRAKITPVTEVDEPAEVRQKPAKKTSNGAGQAKRKRTKERKIGQIIDQVSAWRRYYNGYTDYNGRVVKLSLEEAAGKVGIPKKSLDDYFLQLRLGKTYGFNFNEHKDENVGVLRAFIKNARSEDKRDKGDAKDDNTESAAKVNNQ